MTALDRIADLIDEHRPIIIAGRWSASCSGCRWSSDRGNSHLTAHRVHAEHVAAVIVERFTVVELADPDHDETWRIPAGGTYPDGAVSVGDSVISVEANEAGIDVSTCGEMTAQEATGLAAALLSAAAWSIGARR